MPWNDNSNPGPWGSPPPAGGGRNDGPGKGANEPPRRPQGPRKPNRPEGEGPDLNDIFKKLEDQLSGLLGRGGGQGGGGGGTADVRKYLPAVGGAIIAIIVLSGIVVVGAREQAVVTTFGAYTRTLGPGIGYRVPFIERAEKVYTTQIRKTEVGGAAGAAIPAESLMLTGDENIVELTFTVNWRVASAEKYLFNIKDADSTVKAVAESAMREVVGRTPLDPILSTGRGKVQADAATLMQRMLDSYDAGIIIDGVVIRDSNPPREVVAAFQDVATAGQNAEARINAARGEASKVQQQALGYKAAVVNEAVGQASRFNEVYEQYKLAPGVTRDRLYIETMERVLKNSNKVIIDGKGVSAPIVLSPDVFRPRAPATPSTVAPTPPPVAPAPIAARPAGATQ